MVNYCALVDGSLTWSEEDRLAAVRAYAILDTEPEIAFDDLTRIAAQVCRAPIAVINFIDQGRQWFKSEIGLGVRETRLDVSICAHAILQRDLFVVPDTTMDLRFANNPLVTDNPHLRFYAGALLETNDGLPLGTVCVLDHEPRPEGVTAEQADTLLALARSVMRELELRRANKALAEKSTLLDGTLETMDQGLMMVDAEGIVQVCNQRAIELLDLSPEMMGGKPTFGAVRQYQVEQGEFAKADPNLAAVVRNVGLIIPDYCYERERPNGIVLEVRSVPLSGGGVVRTFTDITARKRAEEALAESERRFRAITDTMPQMVWSTQPNGYHDFYNKRWYEFTGLPEGSTFGDEWNGAFHPDDQERAWSAWRHSLRTGEPYEIEYRLRYRSGDYRWTLGRALPVRNEQGQIERWFGTCTDIHDAKRAEAALAESEARYRALVEASAAVCWQAAPDGSVTKISGLGTFSQVAMCSLIGEGWLSIVHPDDRDAALATWRRSVSSGLPLVNEYRLQVDGEWRWAQSRAVPQKDTDGSVREWVGTITDIHERVLSQNAMAASEERYRLAAWATADAIYDFDLRSGVLRWADGALSIFGYTKDQIDNSMSWWSENVHPDDRGRANESFARFLESRDERWTEEYRFRRTDGTYADVFERGFLIRDDQQNPLRMVGAMQDITERRRAEVALQASEERLRMALSATGLGIWDVDPRSRQRNWSEEMQEVLGLPKGTPASRKVFLDRVHPEDRHVVNAALEPDLVKGAPPKSAIFRITRADNGDERWIEISGRTLHDAEGQPMRMLGTIQDITARKLAEDALRSGGERLRLALHASRMVAWERDLKTGRITRSENSLALLGIGSGPAQEFLERVHPEDRAKAETFFEMALTQGAHATEVRYRAPGDREVWLAIRAERPDPDRLIGIVFDITDRMIAEDRIWRTANHDPLTGLANRALFQTCLEEALEQAETAGTSVSLLLLDLDDFKDVNDTLGHAAGDALLKETAARLSSMVRDCDTVARMGGDEFAVILVEPFSLHHAERFADILAKNLRSIFEYEGRALSTKASIGVAAFPDHHRQPDELLKDADIALYRAKEEGRSRAVVYTEAARGVMEHRVQIVREVRDGLSAGEIVPFYQPKVCFETGRIVGFEALARWQHPTKGFLTPGYFGAVFADPEMSVAIGECIVRQVAADIRSWLDQGLDCGRVAVNLSSAEFADPYLARHILDILRLANVPTSNFEVEVTETVFLGRSTDAASAILKEFHEHGVSVALDDFGTGFASLTHLKQFPVDHIKIDQSFVRNLENDENDAAIVTAVVSLGRSLGMQITAEGVETAGQAQRLRAEGCDNAQGYLYGKPTAGSRVPWFLRTWREQDENARRALGV